MRPKKYRTRSIMLVLMLAGALVSGLTLILAETEQSYGSTQKMVSQLTDKPSDSGQPVGLELSKMNWPMLFIPNEGQIDDQIDFYVQSADKNIYFSKDGLAIVLSSLDSGKKATGSKDRLKVDGKPARLENPALASDSEILKKASISEPQFWPVWLEFKGASQEAKIETKDKAETVVSYFKGDPKSWISGLSTYGRIVYHQLWPGVDLAFSGDQNNLKYEFVVSPGTEPSVIKLNYRGASEIKLNDKGQLEIITPIGSFLDEAPVAYQMKNGEKISVPVRFEIIEKKTAEGGLVSCLHTFKIGAYDRRLPLIIDPAIIVFSGFLGGSSSDRALAMALDNTGHVYLTGWTGSIDFPVVSGGWDMFFNGPSIGTDAFVAKVNPSGTGLIYCSYLGGSFDDGATGIAVDSSGNAYVCGYTKSNDFPAGGFVYTNPAANINQYDDCFLTKISADGRNLLYSGYLGGSSTDIANSVAVDLSGRAYVCGTTESSDFPVKTGPDTSHNGQKDAFILRVNATGSSLDWSGFIGGSREDIGSWIALDTSGNPFITGYTASTPGDKFPVKNGPSLTHRGGDLDAFVAKVVTTGSSLAYCGYIGGSSDDYGAGIAVDEDGCAYVTGATISTTNFPVAGGPDTSHNGGSDAFVAKVNQAGSGLVYCGYLGGAYDDFGLSIAVDSQGIAYLAGATDSGNFPVLGGPYLSYNGGRDAFVTVLKEDGSGFYYSSFLGGSSTDEANAVAADGHGNFYLGGFTRSNNFPVFGGPFLSPGGSIAIYEDAFVTRFYGLLPPQAPTNLRTTAVSLNSVDLVWDDKSTNEEGFKIERKTGSAGTWSEIATVGADVTAYKNTGLSEATNYFYRVRAYNSAGESASSNELSLITLPAGPTALTATAVHERQVNLSWIDNSNGETGFRIERKTGSGPWTDLTNVAANVTTYPDTTVFESITYTYRVFAYNDTGDSTPSNEAMVVTPALTVPIAPSRLQVGALSATEVRLTWVDNSYNEDGFKVERKEGMAGTWSLVGATGEGIDSFTDSGLQGETTYFYRVKAFNSAGDSEYSNEAQITTPENIPRLRVPISGLTFGRVNVCDTEDKTTVIYNDGGAELLVTAVARNSGSPDFSYQAPGAPFTVPPLSSRTITLRFSPTNQGTLSAVFGLSSNDPDNPTADFMVSGEGFIPVITISLEVEKLTERAWIIRRDYGRITIQVSKETPYEVAKYQLWRKVSGGGYELRQEFTEPNFSYGQLVYIDKYLEKGKSYHYKVEALNCFNQVIATTEEDGNDSGSVLKKNLIERLGKKKN